MKITLRNPVDGSTVEADSTDTDHLERLAVFGYRVVGKQPAAPVPASKPAKKRPARKG